MRTFGLLCFDTRKLALGRAYKYLNFCGSSIVSLQLSNQNLVKCILRFPQIYCIRLFFNKISCVAVSVYYVLLSIFLCVREGLFDPGIK